MDSNTPEIEPSQTKCAEGGNGAPQPSLRRQATNSVIWRVVEVGSTQLIQLGISMVLARLIMPDQFGAIAMLGVFLAVSGAFINSGFSTALMRSQTKSQLECSTVFYFNVVISLVAYAVLFFIAPWVSDFYRLPILTPVLRVSAITLVIGSFSAVQGTLLAADLRFKELAKYNVASLVISGALGIWMAYAGWQVWALVGQSFVSCILRGLLLWYKSTWRPAWVFSFKILREYFSFGSKLLASSLLDTLYNNVYPVVIGKVFRAADLAFYTRAQGIAGMTSSMPTGVLQSVTFPTLCKVQDDEDRLRNGYRQMIRISAFVIFPLCLGAGAVAYPLINVLFTERWIFAATLLQIISFAMMWYPIHAINLNLLQVKGRSDLFFRLEVIKKILGVATLCVTIPLGLKAMCYGQIFTSIVALYINTYYTGKLLNLGILKQMHDLLPSLILSIAMYIPCFFISHVLGNGISSLAASVLVGIAIYAGGAILFRMPEMKLLKSLRK